MDAEIPQKMRVVYIQIYIFIKLCTHKSSLNFMIIRIFAILCCALDI